MPAGMDNQWRRHGYPLQGRTEGSRSSEDHPLANQGFQDHYFGNGNSSGYNDSYPRDSRDTDRVPRASSHTLRQKDSLLSFKLPGTWPRDPSPTRPDTIREEREDGLSGSPIQQMQHIYPIPGSKTMPPSQSLFTPPDSNRGSNSPQSSRDGAHSPAEEISKSSQYGVIYGMNQWVPRPYPIRTYKLDPVVNQPPTPPEDVEHRQVQAQVSQNSGSEMSSTHSQWSRPTYPLQTSTQSSVPQSLQAHYSQVTNGTAQVQPSTLQHTDASAAKAWSRPSYPLQSTTESSNIEQATETLTSGSITGIKDNMSSERSPNSGQISSNVGVSKRNQYPLHKQPSGLLQEDKQKSEESSASHNRRTYPLHKQPSVLLQEDKPSETNQDSFSKRAYPLHKQPSMLLKEDSRVSAGPDDTFSRRTYPLHKAPSGTLRNESKPDASTNPWSRQVYPLRSPPSIPAFQHLDSPAYGHTKAEDHDSQKHTEQQGERKQAGFGSTHWKRQTYPLRSPPSVPYLQQVPTPPTTTTEKTEEKPETPKSPGSGPVYIPKNIRATKDAKQYHSKGRTIVVCLDGTGDKFDSDNSNIVHLISSLKKDDPSQVTYYQAGIGTYSTTGLSSGFSAAMDMAVGSQLGLHVRDAYHFLMHTYKEGDKICIFGFSRGAYTARCLAGMIHKVGLLPPRNLQQIDFAYEFYADTTPNGWTQSEEFKKTFCIDVNVYFLGVFDSVASVGFIPRQLPLSSTPTSKSRYFRHAMALDERRAKFKVCRHQTTKKDLKTVSTAIRAAQRLAHPRHLSEPETANILDDEPPEYSEHTEDEKRDEYKVSHPDFKIESSHDELFDTDVLEVWFLGAHADIGGGAVKNVVRHKLAQIPLRWMIRQCFECDTGIIFKAKVLAEFGIDVHKLWPKYEKHDAPLHGAPPSMLEKYQQGLPPREVRRSKLLPTKKHHDGEPLYDLQIYKEDGNTMHDDWTPEHVEDFFDAMSPLNDQLIQAPTWWVLEAWPVEYKLFKPKSHEVYTKVGMNMGRYRAVEDVEPNLHWTVRHRMHYSDYQINARTSDQATWRIVV